MKAIIVTDGKRGHENQSLTLAQLLTEDEEVLSIRKLSLILEAPLRALFGTLGRKILNPNILKFLLRLYLSSDSFDKVIMLMQKRKESGSNSIVTISTGTQPAVPVILLSSLLNAKCIQIHKPSCVSLRMFDKVILPLHDLRPGQKIPDNVLKYPFAISMATKADVKACWNTLTLRLNKSEKELREGKYIALLIGGQSSHFKMPVELIARLIDVVLTICEEGGYKLLLTTSRRTPELVERALQNKIQDRLRLIQVAVWGRNDMFNPVPVYLELSSAVVVTEDSVSMISESILSGHKPVVVCLPIRRRSRKLCRFKNTLIERNFAVYTTVLDVNNSLAEISSSYRKKPMEVIFNELGVNELIETLKNSLSLSKEGGRS